VNNKMKKLCKKFAKDISYYRIDSFAEKQAFVDKLPKYICEDGLVRVNESGMDCDCVQYTGQLHSIQPSVMAWQRLWDSVGEWAEGPFHLSLVLPADVPAIKYKAHDRALEAFEDGHPHSVHMGAM